ncbi:MULTISPECIES: hypothetical protein [Burkholderia]|uniref:hypothetical protein n=1 Tax=Burkholderia TaxID=32008 RepID=UPI00075A92E4|nr:MULTISPECIES: hypothetical protein [Burkholderia]AOJ68307.1 hypothetical protein WS78_05720 [Burkholderia savannae]KVG41878.1 hypothetical protein WS77_15760 [Burkholderia sp. MSMB0265]KVG86463.1 hypothetical protein WS81_03325 [Burkholderia sp. MSMB2040]KVG98679.1 hypothetical protein WS82_26450 [Burkholderia sp. MSMB2041]KVG99474.1 hypothetical protein WS83_25785 [Burkholderia sp. MSMB2042]
MCALFQMIAGAGVGMMQARIQNAQNDAQYKVDSAKTEAANMLSKDSADNNNMIREAGNAFLAAQAALSNTQRSIGNQNRAIAIGSQTNAEAVNMARATDAMVRGSVEQQIAAAGQLGALRADAAASGVGGTSADIMRATMQTTTSRLTTMQATKGAQMSFDQVMAAAGLRSNLITSQDYGQTVAGMNYQKDIAQTFLAPEKSPDITPAQGALMGAAGGAGFQQFRNTGGGSVGGFSGSVGNTANYASQSILGGVSSFSGAWGGGSSGTSGNNAYGFTVGGGDSGGNARGNNSFNFRLD